METPTKVPETAKVDDFYLRSCNTEWLKMTLNGLQNPSAVKETDHRHVLSSFHLLADVTVRNKIEYTASTCYSKLPDSSVENTQIG